MFRRTAKPATSNQQAQNITFISRGTVLTGNLSAQGRVRVHGRIHGNVTVDGVLEVAEDGVIEGELIRAHEVTILGVVKANIEVKGKIEIWQNGRLDGDIKARALDIEEGASFTGRSDMGAEKAVVQLADPESALNNSQKSKNAITQDADVQVSGVQVSKQT